MDRKADPENPKSWSKFILRVDHHMCDYLTSGKRTKLAILSSSLKVWILLKVWLIRTWNNEYIAYIIGMISVKYYLDQPPVFYVYINVKKKNLQHMETK